MKIHEYQSKALLRQFQVPVPRGESAGTPDEAVKIAQSLGGKVWVVKAQIHAGGRGKAGGVKVARSLDEVKAFAAQILGMTLVTHQTGPAGRVVKRLLIEEGADIAKEYYLGIVMDRATQKPCVMVSQEGGMDIEEVAAKKPESIYKHWIDPIVGLTDQDAEIIASRLDLPVGGVLRDLLRAFWALDASLLEINPLIVEKNGTIKALDAKIEFDDNAIFRHPEILALRDLNEEAPEEIEAAKHDLSYIALDGDIGCLVNGAGLAMATMDAVKLYGGEPANFLDIGGGASSERVTAAFQIMMKKVGLKGILVNIFGGIVRCDLVAEGIIAAARHVRLSVPLVVRMQGANEREGRALLEKSGLAITLADDMGDAARKIVAVTTA